MIYTKYIIFSIIIMIVYIIVNSIHKESYTLIQNKSKNKQINSFEDKIKNLNIIPTFFPSSPIKFFQSEIIEFYIFRVIFD